MSGHRKVWPPDEVSCRGSVMPSVFDATCATQVPLRRALTEVRSCDRSWSSRFFAWAEVRVAGLVEEEVEVSEGVVESEEDAEDDEEDEEDGVPSPPPQAAYPTAPASTAAAAAAPTTRRRPTTRPRSAAVRSTRT
jgi:hypothetical protein